MSSVGSAARKRTVVRKKPYVMKMDKKTGTLILERERPPFVGELPYLTAMIITVTFAVFSCCRYIQLRTDVEFRIRQTEALERSVLSLRNDNTLTEKEVLQTPDLSEVYEIAVSELGMVPATEENIRVFERTNGEFVYQTDNIPNFGF